MTRPRLPVATLLPLLVLGLGSATAGAQEKEPLPDWLRSENDHVTEGNEAMAADDPEAALRAYDEAARELPSAGGVHLDRGLALLKKGDLAAAREALVLATRPPAEPGLRADAYYDLGLAFHREADQAAGSDDHETAQKLFREAVDAFRQSLRLRPGNRDAAWNYELAKRRLREQEQKQKEQQDQQQQQDPQQQDPQQQDQQQDPQQQDPQQQDPQQQQDQQQQQDPQQPSPEEAEAEPSTPPLPRDVEQALDALQSREKNLERLKAARRAARERREPDKDW